LAEFVMNVVQFVALLLFSLVMGIMWGKFAAAAVVLLLIAMVITFNGERLGDMRQAASGR